MQISSRFTIGTHVLVMIALKGDCTKVTSDMIAESFGVNPVFIRKTLSQLKKAGLIHVARGQEELNSLKQPMRSVCWISIKRSNA